MNPMLQVLSFERSAGAAAAASRAPAPQPGPSFADMMHRGGTHGLLARPAEPAPKPAEARAQRETEGDPEGIDEAPSEVQHATRNKLARGAAKPTARAREKAPPAAPPAALASETPSADTAEAVSSRRDASDAAVATPAAELRDWLAAQKLAPPGDEGAAATAAQDPARRAGDVGGLAVSGAAVVAADAGTSLAPADEPDASFTLPADAPPAAPALAVATASERHVGGPEIPALREAPAALLSGAAGAVPRGFDAATLAPIALPTPLYSPEFAQALGAQVSMLAKDGVQQAELHLNPAEMGPISVQIELDGQQARVDFSADAAATREVIERGLPELASALREQGFTLAGGGVSQHASDRRDDREAAGGRAARRDSTPPAAAHRAAALPRGLVDVYV